MSDHKKAGIARCPYCRRMVRTFENYFGLHSTYPHNGDRCPLARQRMPVEGVTDAAYDSRAFLVAALACRMQDEDTREVWAYLSVLDAEELRRMLAVALAAVPLDKTVDQIWAWVNALPAAKEATG